MGVLNGWLRNITDVYRLHFDELVAIEDERRATAMIELEHQEQSAVITFRPFNSGVTAQRQTGTAIALVTSARRCEFSS